MMGSDNYSQILLYMLHVHCSDYMLSLLTLSLVGTAKILPVVKKQHLLLCTLLIYNAAAMEVCIMDASSTGDLVTFIGK